MDGIVRRRCRDRSPSRSREHGVGADLTETGAFEDLERVTHFNSARRLPQLE
jgi:hypothetical protein